MIYAAAAAFALGLLAWDIGRRWLDTVRANDVHRQLLNSVSADVARLTDEHGERLDDVADKIKVAIADYARQKLNEDECYARRVNERLAFLEGSIALLPSEPPDLTKFSKALENLVRETRDELAKRPTHEDLKAAETRLHGVLSGSVAKGAKRFA
jgi:hypothetical protein